MESDNLDKNGSSQIQFTLLHKCPAGKNNVVDLPIKIIAFRNMQTTTDF